MKVEIAVLVSKHRSVLAMSLDAFGGDKEACEASARDHLDFRDCGSGEGARLTWIEVDVPEPVPEWESRGEADEQSRQR